MNFFKKKKQKCIFIIEDEPWCARLLEVLVQSIGDYKVMTFRNSTEALQQLEAPDLIISDLFCDEKENEINRLKAFKAPIALLSAHMSVQTAKAYLDDGVDVCLPKKIISMDRECFLNCIKDLIDRKSNPELNRSRSYSSYVLNNLDDIGIELAGV